MTATKATPTVIEAHNVETYHPPAEFKLNHPGEPHLSSLDHYNEIYQQSIQEPTKFFGNLANEVLTWDKPFKTVQHGSFEHGDSSWFLEGELNASYNCVDRHALANPDKVAIVFEADEPGHGRSITYGELLRKVCEVAQVLKSFGVTKGDTVAIYLPMIPEAIISLLAVTRIGAIHSVVFAGFSSGSLKDRINDASSKVVITTDESRRGGKTIETKKIVDEALKSCPTITHSLVFQRTNKENLPWVTGRDFWWHEEVIKHRPYCPTVSVNSEDPLFLLYTSGSTGKPKGIVHSTAGYLLGAASTTKYVFDIHSTDILFTAGDVGWITGHTYCLYGPLLLGATTVVFEGTPAYPNFSRYWDIIDAHKVTHFYVAPTALRLLKRAGNQYIQDYKLNSLRTLGSVGEPIAPDVWTWYNENIGRGKAHICDTYWQTETGSHLIAPMAGITPTKPGSASLPMFGIDPVLIDPITGQELVGNDVEGVLAVRKPWPSMARSIWKDHSRFLDTYLKPYPHYYFTGDGAGRDHDGYYWIRGRVDDVVNVSGHRLSTAEIEAALIENGNVAESAVVGISDELTGQSVAAFVALKNKDAILSSSGNITAIQKELILQVRKSIGPFAAPKHILIVDDLPKTRSGKIMRRILRKVLAGEEDSLGDISTLSNPEIVAHIIDVVHKSTK
ncbi:acetate--CoA ligase [Nadsonia fulvescens var. elongata DSM 6958]|uniref:Acetyl-coenzyme A synthetase n=1 Tax=Nadsonia fulvescens var. elongata DSM 6958 TaxID=857566 RepID=A0A1E3PPW9_9ASCO|nr:acetate--CoA ligase [Nadsonia fulvescens var. elongata DSM 6958]